MKKQKKYSEDELISLIKLLERNPTKHKKLIAYFRRKLYSIKKAKYGENISPSDLV